MPATAAPPKPKPKLTYPKPDLCHRHDQLFREPAYQDGHAYADDDDLEASEDA